MIRIHRERSKQQPSFEFTRRTNPRIRNTGRVTNGLDGPRQNRTGMTAGFGRTAGMSMNQIMTTLERHPLFKTSSIQCADQTTQCGRWWQRINNKWDAAKIGLMICAAIGLGVGTFASSAVIAAIGKIVSASAWTGTLALWLYQTCADAARNGNPEAQALLEV